MSYITDKEFRGFLDEILNIVKSSETKEEAIEKLQSLIDKK